MTDEPTDQPTDQLTDREAHRGDTLPIRIEPRQEHKFLLGAPVLGPFDFLFLSFFGVFLRPYKKLTCLPFFLTQTPAQKNKSLPSLENIRYWVIQKNYFFFHTLMKKCKGTDLHFKNLTIGLRLKMELIYNFFENLIVLFLKINLNLAKMFILMRTKA